MKSVLALTLGLVAAVWLPLAAQSRPIAAERSTLTVFAYKSGLFSAFADDHIVRAPIASGSISEESPLAVEMTIRSGDLVVLDPELSPDKRAEVQERMRGPEVLDIRQYPEIRFLSKTVTPLGGDRWTVTGTLTLHGAAREMTFLVVRQDGQYRGSTTLKQSEFGIRPISIVGGTVRVKDELKIEFEIVAEK